MITNLFRIFDPRSSLLSISWILLPMILIIINLNVWKDFPNVTSFKNKIIYIFKKEVSFTLKKSEIGRQNIIIIIFLLILLINFIALYPYIFSLTSHLSINLPISLVIWIALMIFGWMKNTNHILSHLVPQGTPGPLMMFIVLIELVRNLIRPITLCVRLTANLIAGHLLITLLGNSLVNIKLIFLPIYIRIPLSLTILESAVACIQAYVFITLLTLYLNELK